MNQVPTQGSKRVLAGVLGIFFGAFGIHKFVLGYTKSGVIMLLISLFGSALFFAGPAIIGVIGFIEGVIYLTKSEAEFHNTYVASKKDWF